ncbi:uncharacterized protein MONBRDRAFT_23429 [Monosiga brevicollis MX1]|uniref:PIH1D1/2/3 CS-like domain-containing protein n=1 Tax=Monosiga brevicollis TaxID=81824 RepID=A9UTD5_MONBE|nr:uncharacterized protein MONBRDRAFT_23429 [Monosiga brevicollis MX1]EDQ91473.1 predicted protein [Monosiga brevicollis MX1]|eukprot:XP_001743895.1 hypothetical protein [Monosiga brevicollis MX1]
MRFVAFDTDGPENNPLLEVLVNPELLDSLVAEKGSSDQLLERLLLKAAVSRFGSTTSITPQATWSWVKPYQRLSEADRHASEMEKLSRLAQEQQAASAQPPDIKDPQQLLEALSREAEAEKSGKADDTSAVRLPSQVPSTSGLGVGTSPAQAARPKTKPAIVDLSAPASLTEPAHDASVDDNAGVVTLRVHLPGVTSVAEIDLTLSSDSIQVEVLDTYRLKYTTPFLIQTELGSAKFIKKTATLKLKALRVA